MIIIGCFYKHSVNIQLVSLSWYFVYDHLRPLKVCHRPHDSYSLMVRQSLTDNRLSYRQFSCLRSCCTISCLSITGSASEFNHSSNSISYRLSYAVATLPSNQDSIPLSVQPPVVTTLYHLIYKLVSDTREY
jgi:hypothetical protein